MNVVLWILQGLLAAAFLMAGLFKTFGYEKARQSMPWVKDSSRGLVAFIGISELLGSLGLWLPAVTHVLVILTPAAAIGLAVIMILAAIHHARRGEYSGIIVNVILGGIAGFIAYGRLLLQPFN